jgi:hypothetical protein
MITARMVECQCKDSNRDRAITHFISSDRSVSGITQKWDLKYAEKHRIKTFKYRNLQTYYLTNSLLDSLAKFATPAIFFTQRIDS